MGATTMAPRSETRRALRLARVLCGTLAVAAVLGAAGGAFAAKPRSSAHWAGRGRMCENNAPGHRYTTCLPPSQADRFSFRTSASGAEVIGFTATVGPIYCGNATDTITLKPMKITRGGSFSSSFSQSNRGPNGAVNGTTRVQVRGRFTTPRSAHVFYRQVTHFSQGTPSTPDCGAQVSGNARAR